MKIKICGLRDRRNIQTVLSLRPDYIGLIFYRGSKRFAGGAEALASWLKPLKGIGKTGVFVNEQESVIRETIQAYGLDQVQLHGGEQPELCARLKAFVPVVKAFPMTPAFDFEQLNRYASACDYFLFDTPGAGYGGTGLPFDWDVLQGRELPLPFFLSGGIGPEDVARLRQYRHPAFAGIDINSRFEQSPGIKNKDLLKKFMYALHHR